MCQLTERKTVSSSAADQSILDESGEGGSGSKKNQLFVDVVERVDVILDCEHSSIQKNTVHGSINMRNFLSGVPHIRLSVNEDLVVCRLEGPGGQVFF